MLPANEGAAPRQREAAADQPVRRLRDGGLAALLRTVDRGKRAESERDLDSAVKNDADAANAGSLDGLTLAEMMRREELAEGAGGDPDLRERGAEELQADLALDSAGAGEGGVDGGEEENEAAVECLFHTQ
jgi:hypothetical protein